MKFGLRNFVSEHSRCVLVRWAWGWGMFFLAAPAVVPCEVRTVAGGTTVSLGSFTKMPRRLHCHLWPGFGSRVKLAVLVIRRQGQYVYVLYAAKNYNMLICIDKSSM